MVTGYSNGNFDPADYINREQMALMMYRYAGYKGYDIFARADFSSYQDASNVSDLAQEAMQWAVGEGIITGKYHETQLDPQGEYHPCRVCDDHDAFCGKIRGIRRAELLAKI